MREHKEIKLISLYVIKQIQKIFKTCQRANYEKKTINQLLNKHNLLTRTYLQIFYSTVQMFNPKDTNFKTSQQIGITLLLNFFYILSEKHYLNDFWARVWQNQQTKRVLYNIDLQFKQQNLIEKTTWKIKGIKIAQLFGIVLWKYCCHIPENPSITKIINDECIYNLGYYLAGVILIRILEKKIPKLIFEFHKEKKLQLTSRREELFLIKLIFVQLYIDNIRQLFKYDFNYLVRQINRILF